MTWERLLCCDRKWNGFSCVIMFITPVLCLWAIQAAKGSVQVDVNIGSHCQLTCQFPPAIVTNNGNVYMHWSRENVEEFVIVARNYHSRLANYILHNNSTMGLFNLRIYNATFKDNGTFTCLLLKNGSAEPLFQKIFDLTVMIPPTIPTLTPSKFVGVEGQRLNISCGAWGNPPPLLFWFLQDKEYTSQSILHRSFTNVYSSSTLIITLSQDLHKQKVNCLSWNRSLLSKSSQLKGELELNVHYYPRVKIEGYVDEARIGSSVQFNCVVDSNPMVDAVEWWKDGEIQNTTNFLYLIQNMTIHDQGYYTCRTSNGVLRLVGESTIKIQALPPISTTTETTCTWCEPTTTMPTLSSTSILVGTPTGTIVKMEKRKPIGLVVTMVMVLMVMFCMVWTCLRTTQYEPAHHV